MNDYKVVSSLDQKSWLLSSSENQSWIEDANSFLSLIAIRGLSAHTARAYAFDLKNIFTWLSSNNFQELSQLDGSAAIRYLSYMREKTLQPASINRRLSTFNLFYHFKTGQNLHDTLMIAGHYKGQGRDKNLGLHVLERRKRRLRVKSEQKLVDPLTPDEIKKFFATMHRYRDLAIVQLMLFCGLRSQEVRNLSVDDIVAQENRMIIRGKGQKQRAMPISKSIVSVINQYLDYERPKSSPTSALFVILQGRRRGSPMTSEGFRNLFRHRRRDKSLVRANPHRFRHTFGSDMARSGVRLATLQKMMGHANSLTTLQYVNLAMVDVADAYQKASQEIDRRYRSDDQR